MRDTVHGGSPRKSREARHEEARTGVDRPVSGSARAGRLSLRIELGLVRRRLRARAVLIFCAAVK